MSISYSLPVCASYCDTAGTVTLICADPSLTFIQVVESSSGGLAGSTAGNTASISAVQAMYQTLEKRYSAVRHVNVEVDGSNLVTLFDFTC